MLVAASYRSKHHADFNLIKKTLVWDAQPVVTFGFSKCFINLTISTMRTTINSGYLILTIAASTMFGSCKSNSVATLQDGSITGTVRLVGNGTGSIYNPAGVTASLDGTNYSAQADSNGIWRIDNVAPGNYDVAVSKPGFGTCRVYGVTVEGPGTAHLDDGMYIGIAPTDTPTISNVIVANGELSMVVSLGGNIFFDRDPNVQPGDVHTAVSGIGGLNPIAFHDSSSSIAFSIESLHNAGLPAGTTIYISASDADMFGYFRNYSIDGQGMYYDPVHNVYRLISPGPRSNVTAIKIP
jgi:hypothetical protein